MASARVGVPSDVILSLVVSSGEKELCEEKLMGLPNSGQTVGVPSG